MVVEERERCESKTEKLPLKSIRVTPGAGIGFTEHSQPPPGQSQVTDLFEIIPPEIIPSEKDSEAGRPGAYFCMALMWALFLLTLYLIWQKAAA